jgi:hypothetical protein
MIKNHHCVLAGLVLVLSLAGGCKPAGPKPTANYFKTDFQDESQFIVENIVTDLAEQIYHAKFHRLPAARQFRVAVAEPADSPLATPTYDVQVDLDKQVHGLKTKLAVTGPIWSPEVYEGVVQMLAQTVGLEAGAEAAADNPALLAKLTDGTGTTLEMENQRLSAALEEDFINPALHEQAALLLGAFALREHSGDFYEIRSPLCRITAHLAMARFLGGGHLSATNGCLAGTLLQTLMNNQAAAVETLSPLKTEDAAVTSWVRALQARNTSDYRPLDKVDGLSGLECAGWFYALDNAGNTDLAWGKLSAVQKRNVDFVRIANETQFSVGVGHDLLALSLPLEFQEIAAVHELARQEKINKDNLVSALNQMPDRCFSAGPAGRPGVRVIGWGLWAGVFQRQLCHALQHNFDFLDRKWGVPEDAAAFSAKWDGLLGGLRLYPFVRRFNCTNAASYHQAVDDGFKVTVATPQLTPARCWNYLC